MNAAGRRRSAIATVVAFVVALGLALLVAPAQLRLDGAATGDAGLAQRVRAAAGSGAGFQSLSVAEVTPEGVTYAGVGSMAPGSGEAPRPGDRYEFGSITKTFTGLALAQAVQDGTVRLTDRLETHLPQLAGTPVGGATLGDLATHRAGLPANAPEQVWNNLVQVLTNQGLFGDYATETFLEEAGRLELQQPGEFEYSNLGATLAGLAVASAEGSSWIELIEARVTRPAGLRDTTFVERRQDLPDMAGGFTANGRATPHACCNAFVPAGSATMGSAEDLVAYARAMLQPDSAAELAMAPRTGSGADRTGLFWMVTDIGGREITWHNGGTNGFSSILLMDREAGKAVVVLGNSRNVVDAVGVNLLLERSGPSGAIPWAGIAVLVALVLSAGGRLVASALAKRRPMLLWAALDLVSLGLLVRILGPWQVVSGWAWAVACALAVAGLVLGFLRGRALPPLDRTRGRTLAFWSSGLFSVLFLALAVALSVPGQY